MKCKFRDGGLCFNSGSRHYKDGCIECECIMPISNADHIRSMTDEELAAVLDAFCEVAECRTADGAVCPFFDNCPSDINIIVVGNAWAYWLKQPYEEAPNDPT